MPAKAGMTQPTREPQRLAVYLCNGHLEVRTIQTVQAHNHQGKWAALTQGFEGRLNVSRPTRQNWQHPQVT